MLSLADVSDISYLFFCFGGRGREEESEAKRGGALYLEIGKGGGCEEWRRGGAHRGWEGVCVEGGELNIFFRGRNVILDGRNRARVIAESLARVIAAIRITSVCWRS